MGINLSLVYRIPMSLYVETIQRLRNSISWTLSRSVNPHNLFVLDSTSCFVTLPVCPSITDILQINKAAATPSVTMGTWVLWDAAFSTVWISIGSKSIPCNNVSPEGTKETHYKTAWSSLYNPGICHERRKGIRHTLGRLNLPKYLPVTVTKLQLWKAQWQPLQSFPHRQNSPSSIDSASVHGMPKKMLIQLH